MPRSALHSARRHLCRAAACILLSGLTVPCLARAPQPALRLPLEPLDFQALPAQVLNSGASIATLHYVDAKHLLLTFNRRRLLTRLPGDPDTDTDRNIDALLLELPSGHVLGRTSWRVHDPGQYLWSVGKEAFLLRQRDTLTLFKPLLGLKTGDPFEQQPFVQSSRAIGAVLVSPDGDLLTLETLDRSRYLPEPRQPSPGTSGYAKAAAAAATAGDEAAEHPAGLVQIDFFRLRHTPDDKHFTIAKAGTVASRRQVLIPVDGDGFVSVLDEGRAHWAFNYNRHDGKVDELSPFDSTCHPIPFLVSRSEFVAFGCRGGQDSREIGGFNLRGEEMWEQTFAESFTAPAFSFAPVAGRFALSRLITNAPVAPDQDLTGGFTAQTITVYQTESGRQIFSINCTPILRASENFALSPTGEEIAVLNNGAIEIYPLPALTGKDREGIHLAETLAPPHSEAPILLGGPPSTHAKAPAPAKSSAVANTAPATEVVPTAEAPQRTPAEQPTAVPAAQPVAPTQLGDAPPSDGEAHRKPPTLYGPGESRDGTGAAPAPSR